MSLANLLKKKNKYTLFTTPSHSQKFFIFNKIRQFYRYDISEVEAYNPQNALSICEKKASEIYKTKMTKFLTNGSTSGIIASVLACCNGEKDKVLIWKNSHPSHKSAVKLAGAKPIFYDIDKISDWGIVDAASIEVLEGAINNNEGIKAVIVTSPSYEGVVSDIKEISDICHKNGAFLIVDEAHGALYPFCKELPTSAIYQGADFVIQSLHKTAGGLNPTALLHVNCDIDVTKALKMITTTSPSYPLLASIEKNINFLNSVRGKNKISELIFNIKDMKKNIKTVEILESNDFLIHDDTKIVIKSEKYSGEKLSEILFDKYKIEDEKTNKKSTMLLTGLGCDVKKISKLAKTLKKL